MSTWRNIPKQNIEVDGDEVNILVDADDSGNNYIVVKLSDLKEWINK